MPILETMLREVRKLPSLLSRTPVQTAGQLSELEVAAEACMVLMFDVGNAVVTVTVEMVRSDLGITSA